MNNYHLFLPNSSLSNCFFFFSLSYPFFFFSLFLISFSSSKREKSRNKNASNSFIFPFNQSLKSSLAAKADLQWNEVEEFSLKRIEKSVTWNDGSFDDG